MLAVVAVNLCERKKPRWVSRPRGDEKKQNKENEAFAGRSANIPCLQFVYLGESMQPSIIALFGIAILPGPLE